ncbi:MAG: hypothetical protein Q8O42_09590 [Acidobacteriota bacterium]|nr:hypothetical protein [Acidobacteriota bacterium]
MFNQVLTVLQRGKDNYQSTLRAVDSELRKIVSQDPSQLAAARSIQASYGVGFEGCDLGAAEQPAAPANTAPKRVPKAKAASKPKTKAKAKK